MALHCATVCPGLKVDLPPSHWVLQLQLPSLTLPQFCANAADAKHTAMPKRIVAKPKHFIAPSVVYVLAAHPVPWERHHPKMVPDLPTDLQLHLSRDSIRMDHEILSQDGMESNLIPDLLFPHGAALHAGYKLTKERSGMIFIKSPRSDALTKSTPPPSWLPAPWDGRPCGRGTP